MSTSSFAVSLTLGAVLGAGWVKTFSEGAKSIGMMNSLSGYLGNSLKELGATRFSLSGLESAQKSLDAARAKLEKLKKTLGDKKPTESQTRELARLTKAVETETLARDKQKRKLDEWKKKMRDANVDVEKSMKLMKVQASLSAFSAELVNLSSNFSGITGALKNAFLAASGYIGGLTAATASVSDWGDTMAKTAQRLNMFDAAGTENVERLQRMQWAALQANIENEAFTDALDKMNQVIGQAAMQGGETAKAFERLGLSAKALSGMGADRQFELIVKKLEGVTSASERARIVQQIWGRGAVGMQNLVARGWETIAADMDAATSRIVTGNKRIVDNAGAWDTAMKQLRGTATAAWRDGMLNFMPLITNAMKSLSEKIAANRDRIAEVFDAFKAIGSFAVPAIAAIVEKSAEFAVMLGRNKTIIVVLSAALVSLGVVLTALKLASFAVDVWKTGSALVAVTKSVAAFTQTLNLSALAQKAYAVALGIWKGVTAAATAAQWAWNAAIAANPIGLIALALAGAAALIYAYWEPICGFFSEVWDGIAGGIPAVWERISGFFSRIGESVAAVAGTVKNAFAAAWKWISGALWKVVESSPAYKLFSWAKDAVSAVFASPDAAPAETNRNPLSGTELETMSRAAVAGTAGARTDARTFNTTANISITQQPGEDADALARRVSARLADCYGDISAAAI